MEPTSTVSAAVIIIPVVIAICVVVFLKIWRAIQPLVGWIVIIFAVFAFIGIRMTTVLLCAGVGWIFQDGRAFGEGYIWIGYGLWFLAALTLVTFLLTLPTRDRVG